MAIGATTVWEVRGTTGNSNNGGGYSSGGTDYSQQDTAQLNPTDLATAGASSTITSVTGGFTSAMVGNIIKIASGTNFVTGYYEIITFTDANTLILDRVCDSGVGSSGVGYIGGATNHPQTIKDGVVAGNTIYIQFATYVKVGANAFVLNSTIAGGNATPITWEGYNTTRGDAPKSTDRPVLDGNSNTTNVLSNSGNGNVYKYLHFKDATGVNIIPTAGASVGTLFIYCRSSSAGTSGLAPNGSGAVRLMFCEFDTNGTHGVTNSQGGIEVFGCYIHDNTNNGAAVSSDAASGNFYFTIIESNGGVGFNLFHNGIAFNCLAYNNTGASSDGFSFGDNASTITSIGMVNNISINNGRYGFNRIGTTQVIPYFDFNLYNGNATAGLNNLTAGTNDVTSAPTFTDITNGDFTFSSSSSSGVGVGFPQTMPGAVGDYNWNIGIDQGDHTVGGGGTPGIIKFIRSITI